MDRIAPLGPPYPETVAEDLKKLMPPGMDPIRLFRVVAHNPRVLGRLRRGGLLDPGAVSLRQRELIILRTTALCGAEYEWGVHAAFFAGAAELGPMELRATITGVLDPWALPNERVLFAVCEALHHRATLDDALFSELARHYDRAQQIEAIALAGQYHTISYLTNGLQIALEPGAPRFTDFDRS